MLQNELDVSCISESWLTKDVSSDFLLLTAFQIPGRIEVARRGQGRRSGGVIRDGITGSKLSVTTTWAGRPETLWLAVTAPALLFWAPPAARPDIDDLRHQLLQVSANGKPATCRGTNISTWPGWINSSHSPPT